MMRVLLDENMPRRLARHFSEDVVAETVDQRGWKGKQNGELLDAAQDAFDAFITTDQGIPHQQKVSQFKVGIVLVEAHSNRYNDLVPLVEKIERAARRVGDGEVIRVAV